MFFCFSSCVNVVFSRMIFTVVQVFIIINPKLTWSLQMSSPGEDSPGVRFKVICVDVYVIINLMIMFTVSYKKLIYQATIT